MKIKAVALAVATGLCAFDALAAEQNLYAVGSIGSAKFGIDEYVDTYKEYAEYIEAEFGVSASAKSDDKDTVYSIGGGAKLNQYAAVEFFYRDYGAATASFSATDGVDFEREKAELSASGLGVGLIGFLPVVERLSLLGRLDLVNLKAEAKFAGSSSFDGSFREKLDDTNVVLGLGVGAQYELNDQFAVRLDFQRIEIELEDYEEDVDSFNLSVVASF